MPYPIVARFPAGSKLMTDNCGGDAAQSMQVDGSHWVGSWAVAAWNQTPLIAKVPRDRTLRTTLRLTRGGAAVRVQFSNSAGDTTLHIGHARIALATAVGEFAAGTDYLLQFDGSPSVLISKNRSVMSDPIVLAVPDFAQLVVSFYLPDGARSLSGGLHPYPMLISNAGDHCASPSMEGEAAKVGNFSAPPALFVSGVAVSASLEVRAAVLFGDSNTRIYGAHTVDRLRDSTLAPRMAVLNMGMDGNRLLHDGLALGTPTAKESERFFGGIAGVRRFENAITALPGVAAVVTMEGENDIILPGTMAPASEAVSADAIIEGLNGLIAIARARRIRIVGSTILPFGDWSPPMGSPLSDFSARDLQRLSVNRWIRSSNRFDALVDADLLLRDPSQPARLNPLYDLGDHLHLNPAGSTTLSNAVLDAISVR
jgi:lysophospholipase L1-like esterase